MLALVAGLVSACSQQGPDDELKQAVVENYANGAHSMYSQSLASARSMDIAIDKFLADPSPARLEAAKRAWLIARDDYGPTEVYRFYEGPIDNEATGPEGLINAWPLDESYIDYVEGNPNAGIINNPADFPVIDSALIVSLNEEGGEENVSTGWHAIDAALQNICSSWGQRSERRRPRRQAGGSWSTTPYQRQLRDRRAAYLATASKTRQTR